MKVNELAKRGGVTAETVRHYAREQLLAPQRHPDNGYQLFSDTDLERLRFIQRARKLGFSVAEIRDILTHADQGDSPCPLVRDLPAANPRTYCRAGSASRTNGTGHGELAENARRVTRRPQRVPPD